MKKYLKLLLLGGIFTLIGIFNFSSAFEAVCSSPYSEPCSNGTIYPPSDCNGEFSVDFVSDYPFSLRYGNSSIPNVSSSRKTFSCDTQSITIYSPPGFVSPQPEFPYTVSYSFYIPPIIEGGTETFAPVITGLTNSVNEFIPYVAYIGLGVLGVIISFVAIKRLLRRISAKILGIFKK